MKPICLDCPATIGPNAKTGRCRRCALRATLANPATQAKRLAGIRALRDDDGYVERHRAGCTEAGQRAMQDPERAAQLREFGRTTGARNLRKIQTGETRARAARATRAAHLSWCPPEHWELNALLKRQGFRLPERKEIILADVPGTPEHARRVVANNQAKMQLKHERDVGSRY